MILKLIFIVKFILTIEYLPAIVESHLPPCSSPNIFHIIFIGRRVICGVDGFGDEVALHYVTVPTYYLNPAYYLGGALQKFPDK